MTQEIENLTFRVVHMDYSELAKAETIKSKICEGIFGVKLLQHFDLQQKLIDSCRRAERKA